MPSQQVEIEQTITALKRALRREKEAPSDQPITSATNRGNKLKRGATHVHAGSIPYRYNTHGFKERIEHAGYQRYILERNPRRYNEFGDELNDSDSDEEADADAEDENPYSDVRLEEILRPLTHPAELAVHPTLSQPYLDSALPDMVKSTEDQLRQERANLWRAKNLHRQFIGDESWMPTENVEAPGDWDLFEPHREVATQSPTKKRKRAHDGGILTNGVDGQNHRKADLVNGAADGSGATNDEPQSEKHIVVGESEHQEDKIEGGVPAEHGPPESKDATRATDIDMGDAEEARPNGIRAASKSPHVDTRTDQVANGKVEEEGDDTLVDEQNEEQFENENEATPPPPPRRITRALAAADTSNAATPPLTPDPSTGSSVSSALLQPAPLFLLPPSLTLSHSHAPHHHHLPLHVAHSGLPVDEILETRRLLGLYIQKQEETIRGLEGVLGKLIKAKRRKDRVWEWCKAEGHVGEWSDGEDWVDEEAWGLRAGELRKGRDEEEVEAQQAEETRKGKRRGRRE